MPNSSYLTIDLSAISKNFNFLMRKSKNIMPMVKANAYGTDAFRIAQFFETLHVPLMGVSHVNEAVVLRKKGITTPLFVINVPSFEARLAVKYDLDAAVSSLDEARALSDEAVRAGKNVRVHLSINTGMVRFGVAYQEALDFAKKIFSFPHLQVEGVMTHFASSDRVEFDSYTETQISRFHSIVEELDPKPRWIHAANSFGSIRFEIPFCNLARVGLAYLGFGHKELEGALSLESYLVTIMDAKKGECVGYHCSHQIQKEYARVGVIPMGYHDGLHRRYSEKGYVLIKGKKAPMIGHICMDFMMVDLTDVPEAEISDTVTIFNSLELSAEVVASWGKTDVRELLACLGPRVKRIFINRPTLRRNDDERCHERLSSSYDSLEKSSRS